MRAATDSDPETVKVRNGNALSERIRERLTEESLLYILLLWHIGQQTSRTGGWFPRQRITAEKVVFSLFMGKDN